MMPNIIISERASSSSDLAINAAKKKLPEWTSYLVKEQSKGRGRLGSLWESPKGNLHLSILIYPKISKKSLPKLSFVAALAVRNSINYLLKEFKIDIKFKWPNDILVNNHKIGGILIETSSNNSVIIGVGLNLKVNPKKEKYNWPTQNIFNLTGKEIKPYFISLKIIKEMKKMLEILLKTGFDYLRKEWKKYAAFIGQEVISSKLDDSICGVFEDVGINGEMLIKTKDLNEIRIFSDSVIPLEMVEKYVASY